MQSLNHRAQNELYKANKRAAKTVKKFIRFVGADDLEPCASGSLSMVKLGDKMIKVRESFIPYSPWYIVQICPKCFKDISGHSGGEYVGKFDNVSTIVQSVFDKSVPCDDHVIIREFLNEPS